MADIVLGQHPLLKKEFVDKRIRDLVGHQFVADTLFTGVTVNALAIKYMKDADKDAQGRQAYDDVREIGEGSTYPRIGLTEEEASEMIRKYGLEAAITLEMQQFGDAGQIERAYRKLAMNVKKMVDTMAYNKLLDESAGIQSQNGLAWDDATDGAKNMISDIVDARKMIKDFAYQADTMVISPTVGAQLLKQQVIRDAFRQNNTDVALLRGYIGDFMGLSIIEDENMPAEKDVVLLQRKIIGDIADAQGLRTKTYNQDEEDQTIVRATRFTQAYLTDPKAVVRLKNVIA